MKRKSGSVFAPWVRKPRVPKWRRTNTQPPAPADLRLASWYPGNAPAAKTTERRISKCGAGGLAREKHGVARNGGLYCLSQLKVANRGCTRARAPAPHLVILYQSSDLCSRLAAYRTDLPFWCRSCAHRTARKLRNQCWGKVRGSGKFRPARR